MTTTSAQVFIDQAPAGPSVVIPPGIYSGGLRLNKPLTVNLKGVVLTGVVDAKGFVLVDNTPGPVVIEDFETLLPPQTGTNASGIRVQGGGDVTVRRAHIDNSEMGIASSPRSTRTTRSFPRGRRQAWGRPRFQHRRSRTQVAPPGRSGPVLPSDSSTRGLPGRPDFCVTFRCR